MTVEEPASTPNVKVFSPHTSDVSVSWTGVLPGLLLCAAITLLASLLEYLEVALLGRAWLESLVLAIVLGTAVRSMAAPGARCTAGIRFSAKYLLEAAVMLLGASISARALLDHGLVLIAGISLVVFLSIACSYALGRLFGLPRKLAILIACGNSICGNSAIAAVAPVIAADGKDVASAISFTAVLGVVVVIGLPLLAPLLSMSPVQYGIFAGLTVYAVPQVLAATAPIAQASVQVGTLVKLVRVLMLGPVVLALGMLHKNRPGTDATARVSLARSLPWFILGFLLLMALRSLELIPDAVLQPGHQLSEILTVMSMAALGLGVDVRTVLQAGQRVAGVVILSLLALGAISYGLIHFLQRV